MVLSIFFTQKKTKGNKALVLQIGHRRLQSSDQLNYVFLKLNRFLKLFDTNGLIVLNNDPKFSMSNGSD
jgi:hypothetical protein